MTLQVGEILNGKYQIRRVIGTGGMGAVYEGEHTMIARRVAIKVLYGNLVSQPGVLERFEREAQAAGRIGNDHILEVLDLGNLPDGNRFMVMEFLEGETLGERIQRLGAMTTEQLYPIARQLLAGLSAAHKAGIIHRDLKPDNVFVLNQKAGQADYVKIIDFGISKFTTLDQDMKMTATGAIMGTPYFMSPEQAQGVTSADPRSDIYAVGVILYKAVTGQVPFDGETFNELLFKIVLSPMPQPRELVPELDPAFETLIHKAMARDPKGRFQDADSFISALDQWKATGAAVTVPPPGQTGLASSVVEPQRAASGTQIVGKPSTGITEAKGSWSQPDAPIEAGPPTTGGKKSSAGAWLGVSLGMFLMAAAAGAAVLWYQWSGGEQNEFPEDQSAALAPEPSSTSSVTAPPEPSNPALALPSVSAPDADAGADAGAPTEAADDSSAAAAVPPTSSPPRPKRTAPRPRPRPVNSPKPKPGGGQPDFGY